MNDVDTNNNLMGHYIGAAVGILVLSSASLFAPFFANNYSPKMFKSFKIFDYISLLSNFAGGALLSLGLLHILPESIANMACSIIAINGTAWEYGYALTLLGVVLMLGVECIIRFYGNISHDHSHSPTTHFEVNTSDSSYTSTKEKRHMKLDSESNLKKTSGAIITAFALFVHSIFDGAIIGARTSSTEIWVVTAIISAHKIIASFSLGVSFLSAQLTRIQVIILAGSFLLATPVGLIIFAFIPMNATANGVVGCLSTGALIFVAFQMSFSDGETSNKLRVSEFVSFALGCIVVTGITLLEIAYAHKYHVHAHCEGGAHDHHGHGHNHNHDHSHDHTHDHSNHHH